jgi:hypothetical protein
VLFDLLDEVLVVLLDLLTKNIETFVVAGIETLFKTGVLGQFLQF